MVAAVITVTVLVEAILWIKYTNRVQSVRRYK